MKFSTSIIVYALATTACMAKKTQRRSSRRKDRESRKLTFSYLNAHKVEAENEKLRGRASIEFGDKPIIGVYFQPIYADENSNTDISASSKELPGGPEAANVPRKRTEPPTSAPSQNSSYLNSVPKDSKGGNGNGRNVKNGNGSGTGSGVGNGGGTRAGTMRNENGKKKRGGTRGNGKMTVYGIRRNMRNGGNGNGGGNGLNRNGANNDGTSKTGSKAGSKSGSKIAKSGDGDRDEFGFGTKSVSSECRQLCQGVEPEMELRAPTCNAEGISVNEWPSISDDCCCSGSGISFLQLQFDTMYYNNNPQVGGSFSIVTNSGTSLDFTLDIADPNAAAKKGRARNRRKKKTSSTTAEISSSLAGPTDIGMKEGPIEISNIDGPADISRMDGSAGSIRVVDCDDRCLTSPLSDFKCNTVSETDENVSNGKQICIVQLDVETNKPRFDWKFPDALTVQFISNENENEMFTATIDTTCGKPTVMPWAVVALLNNPMSMLINLGGEKLVGLDSPIFMFKGGMSTGSFLEAEGNPFKEADFQLAPDKCGCDCDAFPPTEAPTSNLETETLPPTVDFSCQPSLALEGMTRDIVIGEAQVGESPPTDSPTTLERIAAPIGSSGTEESPGTSDEDVQTEPPTIVFNVASPTEPDTDSPTRKPVAPPTSLPTITPSATPSITPSASDSEFPSCTEMPDESMVQIAEAVTEELNTCGSEGAKSICKFRHFLSFSPLSLL